MIHVLTQTHLQNCSQLTHTPPSPEIKKKWNEWIQCYMLNYHHELYKISWCTIEFFNYCCLLLLAMGQRYQLGEMCLGNSCNNMVGDISVLLCWAYTLFNKSCNKSCGVGWKSAYHNYHCWNKGCVSAHHFMGDQWQIFESTTLQQKVMPSMMQNILKAFCLSTSHILISVQPTSFIQQVVQ